MEPLQLPLGIPQIDLAERYQQVQQTNPDQQQQALSEEMKRLEEKRREVVQEAHLIEEPHSGPESREEKGKGKGKKGQKGEQSPEDEDDISVDIHV